MNKIDAHGSATFAERVARFAALLWEEAERADASAEVTPRVWTALHRSGLAMAPFPTALGGEDLALPAQHKRLVATLRRLGAGDLSIGRLFEGHVNAVALVWRYGNDNQLRELANRIEAGALSAVWGADDSRGLSAEQKHTEWRLIGRKILASGAGFVTSPLVTAKGSGGQIMALLDLRPGERADISGWTAQGMRSSATGTVVLDDMVVTADEIVGSPGDFMGQPHFSGGAWRFCAVHLGAAERLLDLFRQHLTDRGRDGDAYQQQRVAQCTAAVTTAGFWIREAARRVAAEAEEPDSLVAFVNLTRMVTERAALDVLEAVHRGVGLGGFVRPHPIERISRDLSTYLRQPVPDLAMSDAARTILASSRPVGDLWSFDES